jgi:hypothetical protein
LLFETTLSSQKSVSDKQMKQWGSKTQINVWNLTFTALSHPRGASVRPPARIKQLSNGFSASSDCKC